MRRGLSTSTITAGGVDAQAGKDPSLLAGHPRMPGSSPTPGRAVNIRCRRACDTDGQDTQQQSDRAHCSLLPGLTGDKNSPASAIAAKSPRNAGLPETPTRRNKNRAISDKLARLAHGNLVASITVDQIAGVYLATRSVAWIDASALSGISTLTSCRPIRSLGPRRRLRRPPKLASDLPGLFAD
jgi:hypothetical protein